MSVRAYLVRIIDFYVSEDGYSVFEYEHTNEEIFNLWHHDLIVSMIIDFGVDCTNQDGCGLMEVGLDGLMAFKETKDYQKLSEEEVEIFNRIEKELINSKYEYVQFDCY